jgi:enoyl-CoA hydratase/carnithine racemase
MKENVMSDVVLLNELDAAGCRRLTLNRPDRRNALSSELVEALIAAFESVRDDADTRVVILTGTGDKAFCSGADLDPAAAAAGPFAMHRARRRFVDLLLAMQRCGRPIIGRLAGHAVAGGVGLVAACDLAVAADDVRIETPEIARGLFPMMIMSLIARSVGRKRALKLVMTGLPVSATEAAAWGLINDAVPRDELDRHVDALATQLASMSPVVMQLGRQAFYTMEDMPLPNALEYLAGQLTVNTLTEDAMEGVMAWMQRRPPEWKGR